MSLEHHNINTDTHCWPWVVCWEKYSSLTNHWPLLIPQFSNQENVPRSIWTQSPKRGQISTITEKFLCVHLSLQAYKCISLILDIHTLQPYAYIHVQLIFYNIFQVFGGLYWRVQCSWDRDMIDITWLPWLHALLHWDACQPWARGDWKHMSTFILAINCIQKRAGEQTGATDKPILRTQTRFR